jgi:hypothetical protein
MYLQWKLIKRNHMNANNFTVKSMEVLSKAQEIALTAKHATLDPIHLLSGIL